MNITIISSSPRQNSTTCRVAYYLLQRLKEQTEHTIHLIDMREVDLPMIQNVWSSLEKVPEKYASLGKTIFETDAFILVTPEYNGTYAPAMKNLLDHFPKQSRKPFGIVTASPGSMGGIRASQQLQQMICAFFGIPSPHMLIIPAVDKKFNASGELVEDTFEKSISNFQNEFLWLAEHLVD